MDGVRQITVAVGLAVLTAIGCTATNKVTQSVSHAVKSVEALAVPAAPATQLITVWQRRLAMLPDPTKDGAMAPGLAGQMFLIGADGAATDVAGDVTVALHDDTPGRPPRTAEVYHYTADVIRKLKTEDERFGRSYVLYLPWPAGWQDVTAVRVLSRYEAPGVSLHSGEVKLVLDLTDSEAPVWQDKGTQLGAPRPAGLDTRSVPDGAKVVQQVNNAAFAGPAMNREPSIEPATPAAVPIIQPLIVGQP